jgi:hypothetical protein
MGELDVRMSNEIRVQMKHADFVADIPMLFKLL